MGLPKDLQVASESFSDPRKPGPFCPRPEWLVGRPVLQKLAIYTVRRDAIVAEWVSAIVASSASRIYSACCGTISGKIKLDSRLRLFLPLALMNG